GDKGGEVERRIVEAKHHDAAIVQTVVDEGALRHDQILSGVRAASGRNGFLWTVEIMTSRHPIMSVRGRYRTVINLHNPTERKIGIARKFALAIQPGEASGRQLNRRCCQGS